MPVIGRRSTRPSRGRQRGRWAGVAVVVGKAEPSASTRTMGGRGGGGQQGRAVGVNADDGRAWRWWSARPSRRYQRGRWAGVAVVVSKASRRRQRGRWAGVAVVVVSKASRGRHRGRWAGVAVVVSKASRGRQRGQSASEAACVSKASRGRRRERRRAWRWWSARPSRGCHRGRWAGVNTTARGRHARRA